MVPIFDFFFSLSDVNLGVGLCLCQLSSHQPNPEVPPEIFQLCQFEDRREPKGDQQDLASKVGPERERQPQGSVQGGFFPLPKPPPRHQGRPGQFVSQQRQPQSKPICAHRKNYFCFCWPRYQPGGMQKNYTLNCFIMKQ